LKLFYFTCNHGISGISTDRLGGLSGDDEGALRELDKEGAWSTLTVEYGTTQWHIVCGCSMHDLTPAKQTYADCSVNPVQ